MTTAGPVVDAAVPRQTLEIEGGVRKYARQNWLQKLRGAWLARGLAGVGKNTVIESGVRFMRHPEKITLGDHLIIKEGARICPTNPQARISIGDWTTVGYQTLIFATSQITIGANCLIAPFCYLVDSNHGLRRDALIREQKMTAAPIVIGHDVWLGAGVTVLAGVTIGDGCVVGASSVVNSDLPPYSIAAGIPAKVISQRS